MENSEHRQEKERSGRSHLKSCKTTTGNISCGSEAF